VTPLDYILSCLRRAADNACPWSLTPTEAGALVAEVEKLRAERDHFREAWAAAQVRLDCGVDAADAVREELAAVVAWLRKEAVSHRRDGFPIAAYTMQERADAIERGEHRKEEP
jgi:hypothetical protein